MTAEDWARFRAGYRKHGLIMACGQPGIPKTSQRGLQFFAHKPGAECVHEGGPESPEHLATKAAVARAAREIGWEATIEYPAPDRSWIADVLVSNGVRRLAVEAQWSPQSSEDFERRQARYEAAGLECFWLVPERNAGNASTVPHHVITGSAGDLTITLPGLIGSTWFELGDGVKAILRGDVASTAEFIASAAIVRTHMAKCWNCGVWTTQWTVSALNVESRCGGHACVWWPRDWELWADKRHEQPIENLVRAAIIASDLPAPTKLGRRRSEIMETDYMAMVCPSCGFVQGDGRVAWQASWASYEIGLGAGIRLPFSASVRSASHVCRDIGRGRCSQQLPPAGNAIPLPSEFADVIPRQLGYDQLPPRGSRRR